MTILSGLSNLFHQFFPPVLTWNYLRALSIPLRETLSMALGSVLVAAALGFVFALWIAARLPGGRALYVSLASLRSIPDLTLAILAVVMVGLGPAAGMLALALFYTAAIGKIFSDLLLSVDPAPVHALRATGAGRFAVLLWSNVPLALSDILSYGTFELESAIRASVIVGAVGGGGLGTEIVGTINTIDYRRTTTLLLLLILTIALVDRFAQLVKRKPAVLWAILPLAVAALWSNRPETTSLSHAVHTFAGMLPPQLPPEAIRGLPRVIAETLSMALGGTLLGASIALPLSLCAARNLAPAVLTTVARRILESLRAVPEIVWGLLIVSLRGIGPQAGVFALGLHAAGSLGRLYAESIENIAPEPVYALQATGAPALATALFGYVPLALPAFSVHTLFRLEWNVRAATIVGVIGAGGIGEALFNAQQLFFYQQMVAYILVTWALVLAVDSASSLLRRRLQMVDVTEAL